MVFDATITTEDEVDVMSGENVNATGATADRKAALVKQAESFLSNLLREDVVTGFAGYSANKKQMLSEYGSRYAGMSLIAFNMAGFTSTIEAENMINIHLIRMDLIEKIFSLQNTVTFLKE